MTNAIFMLPHSVLIEVTPPHFTDFCLANLIFHTRLHYIYVPNFHNQEVIELNLTIPDRLYLEGTYVRFRSLYKNLDLTTPIFSIFAAIEDGIEYLNYFRRSEINDYFSPIFL